MTVANHAAIGDAPKRREDVRFLTGRGAYLDDLNRPRQAYAFMLRSPHAHARIRAIDTATAPSAPGVLAVYTGEELARDGIGTNAILRTPPTLFPSHFGSGSFAKHCAEAAAARAQIHPRRNSRLEMDVDDESDLRALLQHDLTGTHTGAFLNASGIARKLLASHPHESVRTTSQT